MTASTPCIRLCVLDDTDALCLGCGRTVAEIVAWGSLPEVERLRVMAGLPQRLAAHSPRGRPDGGPDRAARVLAGPSPRT